MTGEILSSKESAAELSDRVRRLRRRSLFILLFLDMVLMPICYYFLKTFTFRLPVEQASYIWFLIPLFFLLFNVVVMVFVYFFTRSLERFHHWLEQAPAEAVDQAQLHFHWRRLTRIPFLIGLVGFLVIFTIAELVLIFFTLLGNLFLFQCWTASFLFLWLSSVTGAILYLQSRSFLAPYYAMLARKHLIAWAGQRLGMTVKVVGLVVILGIFPTVYLNFAAYRNAQVGLRQYVQAENQQRLEEVLARLNQNPTNALEPAALWSHAPSQWFLLNADGSRWGPTTTLPPLPETWPDHPLVLPTSDPNQLWLVGRANSGQVVGLLVPLSFYYPQMNKLFRILLASSIIILVSSLAIAFLLGRSFTRPLTEMREIAIRLQERETMVETHLGGVSDDEIGELALAMNHLLDRIHGQYHLIQSLLQEIRASVGVLGRTSSEILILSQRQTGNVERQVQLVEETVASSHRFLASADHISERAQAVFQAAAATLDSCTQGMNSLHSITTEIHQSGDQVQKLKEQMDQLHTASAEIRSILEVIEKITDQSELLAVNAALEAAGAGERGRRFSVVAQEVKRLAVSSSESASEIGRRTQAIISRLDLAIRGADQVAERVLSHGKRIQDFSQALSQLSHLAQETTRSAETIARHTTLQNQEAQKLARDLEAVHHLSRDMEESANQVQAAVAELTKLTEQLKQR